MFILLVHNRLRIFTTFMNEKSMLTTTFTSGLSATFNQLCM